MTLRDPAPRAGFTLIEVVGALLIFSAGVIMLLNLTGSLSRSLEYSAINSVITAEAQERIDSLGALSYASLTVATTQDALTFRGVSYQRTQTITQFSPLVRKVVVALMPVAGTGPSFSASIYLSDPW